METIENIVSLMGANDIDARLEEQLIDGIVYAFQEQTQEVCCTFIKSFEVVLQVEALCSFRIWSYKQFCCFH